MPVHRIALGEHVLDVEAEVSQNGSVQFDSIRDQDGRPIRLVDLGLPVRIALCDRVRQAQGRCTVCGGGGRAVEVHQEGRRQAEGRGTCEACRGSGCAPQKG